MCSSLIGTVARMVKQDSLQLGKQIRLGSQGLHHGGIPSFTHRSWRIVVQMEVGGVRDAEAANQLDHSCP